MESKVKVILVSGKAQNGKDTTANFMQKCLEENGKRVLVTHYADLLKFICKNYFGWDGNKDDNGRQLLQYVGTDVIRKQNPSLWVDFVSMILGFFGENWDYVIIPDTRFPNEIDVMREKGFDTTHIRVSRENFQSPLTEEQQKHPSEIALDNVTPDIRLVNRGSLEEFEQNVRELVEICFLS